MTDRQTDAVVISKYESKKRHMDVDQRSDSDSDGWGNGYVLDGSSSGIAAAGFYGERSGPSRNLRSVDTSTLPGSSGERDVSSYTASEIAREVRHRNREQRSKVGEKVKFFGDLLRFMTYLSGNDRKPWG